MSHAARIESRVRHDNQRRSLHVTNHVVDELLLGLGVETGGYVIEQENPRAVKERPGRWRRVPVVRRTGAGRVRR